jgi:tRNA nucleotidyltransferase (CCA-adding enzyme)
MSAGAYLQNILARETVDTGPYSPVRGVQSIVAPIIREWAGNQLVSINPSGSFAKGTANASGTDIDLFISLAANTTNPLKEIYGTLANRLQGGGYTVRRQNVSLNIRVGSIDVDLVPAKRQDTTSEDHSRIAAKPIPGPRQTSSSTSHMCAPAGALQRPAS